MEDEHVRVDVAEPLNAVGELVGGGVATACHYNTDCDLIRPAHVDLVEAPLRRRFADREEVALEARHQHLRLRVAEAGVYLHDFWPICCDHDPGVKRAVVGCADFPHPLHDRLDDFAGDALRQCGVHAKAGAVSADAARVEADVAVLRALVVGRGRHKLRRFAVAESVRAGLPAGHVLLDDDGVARAAEVSADHDDVQGVERLGEIVAADRALARGEAVRLHPELLLRDRFDVCPGLRIRAERTCRGGGDSAFDHELLRPRLARFQLRGGLRWSVTEDACRLQPIDQAEGLRVVHGRQVEVDAVLFGRADEAVDVLRLDRQVCPHFCRASIARRDKNLIDERALTQLPSDGVFASAHANQKYASAHQVPPLAADLRFTIRDSRFLTPIWVVRREAESRIVNRESPFTPTRSSRAACW